MTDYFMGLDISTQSCKCVVIDTEKRVTIYQDTINYDTNLPQYHTKNGIIISQNKSIAESNPLMWIDAIKLLFTRLLQRKALISQIRAISVSGQQHGLVTLDKTGQLSRPYAKLWNDFSTEEECYLLTEKIGGIDAMIASIGNTQRPGYTASKIYHMVRHEPELYDKTAHILLVHNFINWYLTGGPKSGIFAMEAGDVSGSALWNPITRSWSQSVINAIDSNLSAKLPSVFPSRQLLGSIGADLCQKYGFSPDCMIASGSGDNMMAAIGTGNVEANIVTISLGTSGTAYTVLLTPFVDPTGEIALFCDAIGQYLPLLCISNMANGYTMFLDQYHLNHQQFSDLVQKTPIGNKGRVIIPWYTGERTPDLPSAVPIYFGFNFDDFIPEIIGRAILEGHIMNLFEGFQKIPIVPSEIRLTGGISRSPIWQHTIANIFNCPILPIQEESAAFGAALHALWSFHPELDIKEIIDQYLSLHHIPRILPDPTAVQMYSKFKQLYIAISRSVRGLPSSSPFKLFHEFNSFS